MIFHVYGMFHEVQVIGSWCYDLYDVSIFMNFDNES